MMNEITKKLLLLFACAPFLVGCSGTAVEQPEPNAEASLESESVQEAENSAVSPAQTSDPEEQVQETKPEEPPVVAFEPPFPDRLDLFSAPKRQGKVLAKTKGQEESAVELLGFSNVGQPQALLAVNGIVTPLAEGEKYYGIEVISIQPPKVVLQRGRQRWQATIEYN